MSVDPFTIVLGDLNTRMGSLTGDCKQTARRTPALKQWMSTHDLTLWNAELARGQPTYSAMRRPGYHARPVLSESIIDFFLSMPDNMFDPRMKIHTGLGLSDHHLCELSFVPVNMSRLPAATAQRLTWNLQRLKKPAMLDRYQTRFEELSGALLGDIRTCLNANDVSLSTDRMEGFVDHLNTVIYQTLDDTVGRTRPRLNSHKDFWNDHLQRLADRRQRWYKRWRRLRHDIECITAHRDYISACADIRKAVKGAQRQSWTEFCQKLHSDPTEMTSAIKRLRLRKRSNVTISTPQGPKQAADDMAAHLEQVCHGSVTLRISPDGVYHGRRPCWVQHDIVDAIR
ncbi:hypothetical protein VTP01DRAFT_9292 [Rhizomucor pusillus]|uniref:uncharacterized protein n=1 Tax=Rhizomucor pusillus TaxID=4840 RepID=UPI003742A45A